MLEPTDITVEISFNYQGDGQSPFPNGVSEIAPGVFLDIDSDYDEEEDDSIVCVTTKILQIPFPKILDLLQTWASKELIGYALISMEVHCGIEATKINHNEALQIKLESDAWQLDIAEDLYNFIYMNDIDPSTKIGQIVTRRITNFWKVVDDIINI